MNQEAKKRKKRNELYVARERPQGNMPETTGGPGRRKLMKKRLWTKNKVTDAPPNESFDGIKDIIGNGRDPSFACRLAFEEGPYHHAYSNAILANALLRGIREVSVRLGTPLSAYGGEVVEVPMRHPPHLGHFSSNGVYPLDLPVSLLLDLASGDEQCVEEMIEALSLGAPHHVMANIIILHLAEVLTSIAMRSASVGKSGS